MPLKSSNPQRAICPYCYDGEIYLIHGIPTCIACGYMIQLDFLK